MPSLIDIRRRIRAVKSTQQITKAMKMVAASKLRRSQERIFNARPYAREMQRVLSGLAARVDPTAHPLLDYRSPPEAGAVSRTLLFIVTADKGLCGSFNTNVIKAASTLIVSSEDRPIILGLVGRKGRDFFRRRGLEIVYEQVGLFQALKYADAQQIARAAIEEFTAKSVDRVLLVYNEFKSAIQQRVVIEDLLPIPRAAVTDAGGSSARIDYLYEPAPQEIFNQLLPRYVETQVYRALLESNAAFFAAQMTAMDTANKNATEMISQLTLYMNKVRQAAITREIIEVVSGAGAL
jgi:F-type H+-transporting ATPase subunit gamma